MSQRSTLQVAPSPVPLTRPQALGGSIIPSQLWAQLTPSQQQQVRQTVVTVCQQWLVTCPSGEREEKPHDDSVCSTTLD